MDPISITAGVVAITAACLKTANIFNNLHSKYLGPSATIAAIVSESTLVSASLSQIQTILLRNSTAVAEQLQTRPELAATFDTTLIGCTVVFACLEEEANRLNIEACKDGDEDGWKYRAKIAWNAATMRELLQSIRGQQGAITLLIQMLQMESLSDIHRTMQDNTAVLRSVVQRTRSLRSSNPQVSASIPDSILGRSSSIVRVDNASTIGTTEFDFDDLVVNSKAYRRALESLQKQKQLSSVPREGSAADLIDLSGPDSPTATFSQALCDLEGLQLSSADDSQPNGSIQSPSPALSSPTSLRRGSHTRRNSSTSSYSSCAVANTSSPAQSDFWSTVPNLKLNDKLVDIANSESLFSDTEASSIFSYNSASTQSTGSPGFSLRYRPRQLSTQSPSRCNEEKNPFADLQDIGENENLRSPYAANRLYPLPTHLSAPANRSAELVHGCVQSTNGTQHFDRPNFAHRPIQPATNPLLEGLTLKPATVKPKLVRKKHKSVSFQLPENNERAAIEKKLREERKLLEERRRSWDRRRRASTNVEFAGSGSSLESMISHERSGSCEPRLTHSTHRPVHSRRDSGVSMQNTPQRLSPLRGEELPAPAMATAAIMRAAQSVYALNGRPSALYPPSTNRRPWRPPTRK
ncbi:hypothetical protein BCR34DRAFT_137478 [Clohesyomyces aquaticus]|uniref:Fungal N-terminal domain-containing protein n=1 Tax=Clohesyomyces aquaticus TaxID=1231657 RepID=A0A1Y2A0Z6_9PLEO|nr:hypothetical protein BCR34DRAFT_137478 [Clohesyomyces aquaticus]